MDSWDNISQRYYSPWIFAPWKWHRGIDYVAPCGAPIYASNDGVVVREGYVSDYGNMVQIHHDNGYDTLYAHLDSRSPLNVNDRVDVHTMIGREGTTGLSTGCHLHFELRLGDKKLNPENFNFITRQKYMDLENEIKRIDARLDDIYEYAVKNDKEKKVIDKKIDNRYTKKQTKELISKKCK